MTAENEEKKWKIRDADGKTFGPASMESLKAWARDGRLVAQMVSYDGNNWFPAESLPELEMDWLTKLPDGRYFGPMNRDAMKEYIHDGDITEEMPMFVRMKSIDESPETIRRENEELRNRIVELRKDFEARASKLEADLAGALSEKRMASNELSTRDLDFEAERQAFNAERSRMDAERQGLAAEKLKLKAEIAKAEKRAEVLLSQVTEAESRSRSREVDVARIAELEKQIAELNRENKRLKAELDNQAADARRKLKDAEVNFLKDKEELEGRLKASKDLSDRIKAYETREESLRRILMQANSIIGKASGKNNEVITDADAYVVE